MRYVFDIESDGLYHDATRIHCGVLYSTDQDKMFCYEANAFDCFLQDYSTASMLVGHNIIDYDIPLIEKLTGTKPRDDCIIYDTLVMSRLFNPNRPGGHSLEAWGERVGIEKIDIQEWGLEDSSEYILRCLTDVKINVEVFKLLCKEGNIDV